ncbi:hypothetical protein ZTR_05443 [Talaromyces verruculosus]|nr:hypothetical protein ZTR_05443 [Talaromyces verruculosus]
MPQQQQQPRRILEKSRTVRRRYQRSNKRFEFSASQIQRIEREEEREKKAKQLREREKKKLANKKKRAEKEAKDREERRRLGIPEPNACKIPASQPLLLNFFGAGRQKEVGVKGQTEEETEDSAMMQESASEEEDSIEIEDERKQDSLSPVQEEEDPEVVPQQQPQQPSKTDDTTHCISEDFSDLETELGDDFPVRGEEPDVMQQQEPQQLNKTDDKPDDTTNCIPEDFSDLETELGDDWLNDPEMKKHMASIENTQQNLSSSAMTYKDDQPTEPAQNETNNWAGMTESFEDDTSLMLQALDPTVLEEFETPRPKAVLHEVNKTATSSPSVSTYAASNVRNDKAQYDTHRFNNPTLTNFKNASPATNLHTSAHQTPREIVPQQQIAQKQQLRTTATSSNIETPTVHNTPPAFKKPVVAASMQPRRLHFSPKKSFNYSTKTYAIQKTYSQPHFDAEDEFGDLPLSTQDVRDLDTMVGLG